MTECSFILSLTATFAGAFLAFLLDRVAFRSDTIRKRKDDKTKLKIALISIANSIEYNKNHYISLSDTIKVNSIKVVLPTDTFTWDAYKGDVFNLLKDISLRNDLIYYFLVANTIKYLSDNYYIMFVQKEQFNDPDNELKELRTNVEMFTAEILSLGDSLFLKLKRKILEL